MPKKPSSAGRTRQTRLTFTPLPSSSPTYSKTAFPPAAISYEGSSAKRRELGLEKAVTPTKAMNGPETAQAAATALPTPGRSSQADVTRNQHLDATPAHSDDQSLMPGASSRKSHTGRPRGRHQGRLSPGTRREVQRDHNLDLLNMAAPTFSKSRGSFNIKQHEVLTDSSDSSDQPSASSAVRIQPTPTVKRQSQRLASRQDELPSPLLRTKSGRKAKPAIVESSEDEDTEAGGIYRRRAQLLRADDNLGEPESSFAEMLQSSPIKRPRNARKAIAKQDDFIVLSEEEISDDAARSESNRRNQKSPVAVSDDDDESEANPRKRRRLGQEEEDLAEDLEFLRSSPPAEQSSPIRPKFDARKEALERLKRKRASKEEQTQASRRRRRQIADESDEDSESEAEDSDEAEAEVEHQEVYLDDSEGEQGDFVVEDEEGPLGVPDLPLEFSSISRMKGRELFKYVVEWMVQKKLNPAFAIDDELYDLAFRKVDDEVKGLAGSKFRSAAWTQDFTFSLQARPVIFLNELGRSERKAALHHCEACNRKSHPATWRIQFIGKPYNPQNLEEIDNDTDSNDSESNPDSATSEAEDRSEYDCKGRRIPPQSRVYHVGQYCMRNAQTAHALEHWRFQLYELIVDELKVAGVLDAERIVERDSWKEKRRRKFANRIVDGMENEGRIKALYRDFRAQIDEAREKKVAFEAWVRD